jgi:hypothetical protein
MTHPETERRRDPLRRAIFEKLHAVDQCDESWPGRDWTNRAIDAFYPVVQAHLTAQSQAKPLPEEIARSLKRLQNHVIEADRDGVDYWPEVRTEDLRRVVRAYEDLFAENARLAEQAATAVQAPTLDEVRKAVRLCADRLLGVTVTMSQEREFAKAMTALFHPQPEQKGAEHGE